MYSDGNLNGPILKSSNPRGINSGDVEVLNRSAHKLLVYVCNTMATIFDFITEEEWVEKEL